MLKKRICYQSIEKTKMEIDRFCHLVGSTAEIEVVRCNTL